MTASGNRVSCIVIFLEATAICSILRGKLRIGFSEVLFQTV